MVILTLMLGIAVYTCLVSSISDNDYDKVKGDISIIV